MKMLFLCELKPTKTQLTQNQNVVLETSVRYSQKNNFRNNSLAYI